jgi:hypothetical protein
MAWKKSALKRSQTFSCAQFDLWICSKRRNRFREKMVSLLILIPDNNCSALSLDFTAFACFAALLNLLKATSFYKNVMKGADVK